MMPIRGPDSIRSTGSTVLKVSPFWVRYPTEPTFTTPRSILHTPKSPNPNPKIQDTRVVGYTPSRESVRLMVHHRRLCPRTGGLGGGGCSNTGQCVIEIWIELTRLVFNKIVITALKFTPVVVAHHLPYRTLPNGKMYVHSLIPYFIPTLCLIIVRCSTRTRTSTIHLLVTVFGNTRSRSRSGCRSISLIYNVGKKATSAR